MIQDLTVTALYFLLRVGKYTTITRQKKKTWIRQFCVKDATFSKYNRHGQLVALLKNAPTEDIMDANAEILHILNQKNRHEGVFVNHEQAKDADFVCPAKALSRRVDNI